MTALEFACRGSSLKRPREDIFHRFTEEQRTRIVEEWASGKSSGVLARKYRISTGYIHYLASRHGYRRRA
jgi:Mor family transcriptional regulator